jgi:hypothetical protein
LGNNLQNRLSNVTQSNRPGTQVPRRRNLQNAAQNPKTKIAMQTARKNVQKAKRILANKRRVGNRIVIYKSFIF